MKRKSLVLILVLIIVAASYAAFRRYSGNSPNDKLIYSGTVEVVEVLPSFQVAGRIDQFAFEEGQTVEAGQILALSLIHI